MPRLFTTFTHNTNISYLIDGMPLDLDDYPGFTAMVSDTFDLLSKNGNLFVLHDLCEDMIFEYPPSQRLQVGSFSILSQENMRESPAYVWESTGKMGSSLDLFLFAQTAGNEDDALRIAQYLRKVDIPLSQWLFKKHPPFSVLQDEFLRNNHNASLLLLKNGDGALITMTVAPEFKFLAEGIMKIFSVDTEGTLDCRLPHEGGPSLRSQ